VKVRPDGTVKVLDFGLSKVLETESDPIDISSSPTVTSPVLTESAVIMGTAAYMSPEQARGKHVDRRADIWAFGCVLYEMLTGTRAYKGSNIADVLAAILHIEPAWDALPVSTPPKVRDLLRRCLVKDAKRRLRDMGEARIALEETKEDHVDAGAAPHRLTSRWLAAGIGLALLAGTAAGTGIWLISRSDPRPVTRLSIVPPANAPLNGTDLAVSPDGRRIVYVSGNGTQLSVRSLDELTPDRIANLGSPRQPFISPDGEWIGFFDGMNALKKVPISGGPAVFVASLGGAAARGASWSTDGTIVFATDDPATGLWRVSENGGAPALLTKGERGDHTWPHVLPDGQAILFTQSVFQKDSPEIAMLDSVTGERRVLMPGSRAQYVPTGHLIYDASGTLRVIGFNLGRRAVVGISRPVLDQVPTLAAAAREL
jgi:serine/threonine-protein kinase